MTKGETFVAHYPSMFTEDTEWWAQKLDEHFVWSEDKLIDFVNWYVKLKKLPVNYELENKTIIHSFLNGDDVSAWKPKCSYCGTPVEEEHHACERCCVRGTNTGHDFKLD